MFYWFIMVGILFDVSLFFSVFFNHFRLVYASIYFVNEQKHQYKKQHAHKQMNIQKYVDDTCSLYESNETTIFTLLLIQLSILIIHQFP